jgi:hypothetical protein
VRACGRVVGVGAARRIRYRSSVSCAVVWTSKFLNGGIRVRASAAVLAVPDRRWSPVGEAEHGVFPVADMVAEDVREEGGAAVVAVEVEVEGVDGIDPVVMIDDDHNGGNGVGDLAS